jgi:hypothetical protein
MSASLNNTERLGELLAALREDALDEAGAELLVNMLASSREARRTYIHYMSMVAFLHGGSQEGESRESRVERECAQCQWPVFGGQCVTSEEWRVASGEWRVESEGICEQWPVAGGRFVQNQKLEITNHKYPAPRAPLPSSLSAWAFSYSVATVLLAIALLGAWSYTITHPAPDSLTVKNSRGATPTGETEKETPEFTFVGRVSGMVDCQWSDPATETYPGAAVALNRRYALKSGLMEITYDSGAKVILQGPCDYKVESPRGGFLQVGKLVARVASGQWPVASGQKNEERVERREESAENQKSENRNSKSPSSLSPLPSPLFSVRTPTAWVEDLGTEFGVEVSASGETASHVFQGQVVMRIEGTGSGGRGAGDKNPESPNPRTSNPEIILSAGQIGSVKRGEPAVAVSEAAADSRRFVRSMPLPKFMSDSEAYAKLVLSLKPVVYYRMERPVGEKDRRIVFDSASGGHHGELRLGDEYGGPPYRPGRFGDSLWLRGPERSDRAIVRNYPKTTNDRLTVSAWVLAMGCPGWAMIAANWGDDQDGSTIQGQFRFGLYRRDGDLSAIVASRNGQEDMVVREGALQPLPMFTWQHVAFVADGPTLRLYRNGKEVASSPGAGVLPQPAVASLGIGCRINREDTDAMPDTPGYQYWQGRIDELAIFNEALSAETIERLYLGQPPSERPAEKTIHKEIGL